MVRADEVGTSTEVKEALVFNVAFRADCVERATGAHQGNSWWLDRRVSLSAMVALSLMSMSSSGWGGRHP